MYVLDKKSSTIDLYLQTLLLDKGVSRSHLIRKVLLKRRGMRDNVDIFNVCTLSILYYYITCELVCLHLKMNEDILEFCQG